MLLNGLDWLAIVLFFVALFVTTFAWVTVKKAFPEIEVRASVNMRLTTVQAMAYLAPWFDSYYLGRDVQRNLETVKRAADWCHRNGKTLGNLLDLLEPGFSPAFAPRFLDNTAFSSDRFDRTGACTRECANCGYCEKTFRQISKTL